jgi:hypothetical protein
MERAIIDPFAADRSSKLSEVNSNLMSPTRLEPTFDERKITQALENTDGGNGPLAPSAIHRTATPPVTAIRYDQGFDTTHRRTTTYDREITSADLVRAELSPQFDLRIGCSGKHQQPARVSIEPVNSTDGGARSQDLRQPICQGARQKALRSRAKLSRFVPMSHGGQARRLLHDDDVFIDMNDADPRATRGSRRPIFRATLRGDLGIFPLDMIWRGSLKQRNPLAGTNPTGIVPTGLTLDLNPPCLDPAACFRP